MTTTAHHDPCPGECTSTAHSGNSLAKIFWQNVSFMRGPALSRHNQIHDREVNDPQAAVWCYLLTMKTKCRCKAWQQTAPASTSYLVFRAFRTESRMAESVKRAVYANRKEQQAVHKAGVFRVTSMLARDLPGPTAHITTAASASATARRAAASTTSMPTISKTPRRTSESSAARW
mmetsp:Transcript_7940/g.15036  ORF Transcript_7940/g.15036 Transcript_7940/m.15036 type:complete len:176 (+) Transcript_7940:1446-1973(+)